MKTDLSHAEIEAIMRRHYGVGAVRQVSKVIEATSSVYRVNTPSEQLILKVYDWQGPDLVQQEIALLCHLQRRQYPCPEIKFTASGEGFCLVRNHPTVVTRFVNNTVVTEAGNATRSQLYDAGRALAELHLAATDCHLERHLCDLEDMALMLREFQPSQASPEEFVALVLQRDILWQNTLP